MNSQSDKIKRSQNYTGKYHAVWIDKKGYYPVKGIPTSNFKSASDEAQFHRNLGAVAWIEDDESNKIEE